LAENIDLRNLQLNNSNQNSLPNVIPNIPNTSNISNISNIQNLFANVIPNVAPNFIPSSQNSNNNLPYPKLSFKKNNIGPLISPLRRNNEEYIPGFEDCESYSQLRERNMKN